MHVVELEHVVQFIIKDEHKSQFELEGLTAKVSLTHIKQVFEVV